MKILLRGKNLGSYVVVLLLVFLIYVLYNVWQAGCIYLFYVFLFVKYMWRSSQDDAATAELREKDTTARQSQRFVIFIYLFFFWARKST